MSEPAEAARGILEEAMRQARFSAAAFLVSVQGQVVAELYLGSHATLDDAGEPLALERRESTSASTLFDLASITKVLTAHTALSLVDEGAAGLDDPIASVLPEYRSSGRREVTLRHLLSHTSGLPSEWTGWRKPLLASIAAEPSSTRHTRSPIADDRAALIGDLLSTPLDAAPGTGFTYSCAGYNTAVAYLERLTARPWPELVAEHTTTPLGLGGVTARPDPARAAATEFQPQYRRGVVRGDVHDEAAWSLGGRSGNAGLFASGPDLLRFGEAVRRGAGRVMGEWMWDDALSRVLGRATADGGGFGSALGLRIGDRDSMSASGPSARTHIGFTGTLLHIDRATATTIVLLTNRVHPSRQRDIADIRRRVVDVFAG